MLADEQTVQPRHLRGSRTNGLDLQWLGVTLPGGRNRAHEKKRKRQDAVEGHAQDSEGGGRMHRRGAISSPETQSLQMVSSCQSIGDVQVAQGPGPGVGLRPAVRRHAK